MGSNRGFSRDSWRFSELLGRGNGGWCWDRTSDPRLVRPMLSLTELTTQKMAERTGLEPATSGVTGRHSNHLNYRSETALQGFPCRTRCAF